MARISTTGSQTFRVALLLTMSALLHSGCATISPYRPADRTMPEVWRNLATAGDGARVDGMPAAPAVDLQHWWEPFHESALEQLVSEALEANLGVREAAARLRAARALASVSGGAFRPQLRIAAGPATAPDASRDFFQAGFDVSWEAGLFGRAGASGLAATADSGTAAAEVQAARASVVAETVRAYLDWRASQAEEVNLTARIAAQSERVELTETRERLRLAASRELDQENARLQELQSQRLALRQTATDDAERLGLLLARTDAVAPATPGILRIASDTGDVEHGNAPIESAVSVPSIVSWRLRELPADLLRTRPDIRRAEMSVLKAAAELGMARAELYPRLVLGGSLMVALPVAGGAFGAARSIASVGPTLDIPLFDWGQRHARVVAEDANLDAALLAYRESILEGVHEVESALAALEATRVDAEAHRVTALRAERTEESARTASRLHLASRLEVLAAQLDRLEAQAAVLRAERAHGLAFVALFKALGGASLPTAPS